MLIGRHFTLRELTRSTAAARQGLDNTPGPEALSNLRWLRDYLGRAINPTSGFRSPAVNRAVGGSSTSAHKEGLAADIKVPGLPAEELARAIVRSGLIFDQCIWYDPQRGGHVHLGLKRFGANRGQTLHAPAGGGYLPWNA
jgi:zinc D-Ala-D-Ala carboxypeptidase